MAGVPIGADRDPTLNKFVATVQVEWDPDAAVTPLGHLAFFAEHLKLSGRFDALVAARASSHASSGYFRKEMCRRRGRRASESTTGCPVNRMLHINRGGDDLLRKLEAVRLSAARDRTPGRKIARAGSPATKHILFPQPEDAVCPERDSQL